MDINELLAYKPDQVSKRSLDDGHQTEERNKSKRVATMPFTADDILKLVEQEPEVEPVDETMMKRLLLSLEKRILRNQEMRIKHGDQPERFLESELELHGGLQELHVLATAPHLYPQLARLGGCQSLLALVSHDNTDIVIAVIALLQELMDVDDSDEESQQGAGEFVDWLLQLQGISILVQALERLDESQADESAGVYNVLSVAESMCELRPQQCTAVAQQGLLAWLLARVRLRVPFDINKLFTTEILSVLVQSDEQNKMLFGELDGIDVLLQQLAHYKRRDPASSDEHECVQNMFDVLCSVLLTGDNKDRFLRGEGLQLMNLMLREKKQSRVGALKVLNYATAGPQAGDNCNKLVEILALRSIFPLFMHTPSKNKRKGMSMEEHEEHVVSIVSALMRHCRGPLRQRIVSKFLENDCEKIDRLMELHFKYLDKVQNTDAKMERVGGQLSDTQTYMRRLEGGLFTLQLIDLIIAEISAAGHSSVKQRVMQMLNIRNASVKTIRNVVREYAGNLGEADDDEERQVEQQRILQLVDKF